MNELSKTTQKLLALSALTCAILISNGLLSDQIAIFAKSSKKEDTKSKIGKSAPEFSLKDAKGKTWSLDKLKGKVVVLEWFNFGCPFVKKHYDSGNMQKLQNTFIKKGVVWLSVCSSAKGRQGYQEPKEHLAKFKKRKSSPSAVLLDTEGTVGKLYGAKSTPHMFVIGKDGILLYAGAIDDTPGFDKAQIKQAKNYVKLALNEVLAGKPVSKSLTKSYGCSVKYKK